MYLKAMSPNLSPNAACGGKVKSLLFGRVVWRMIYFWMFNEVLCELVLYMPCLCIWRKTSFLVFLGKWLDKIREIFFTFLISQNQRNMPDLILSLAPNSFVAYFSQYDTDKYSLFYNGTNQHSGLCKSWLLHSSFVILSMNLSLCSCHQQAWGSSNIHEFKDKLIFSVLLTKYPMKINVFSSIWQGI